MKKKALYIPLLLLCLLSVGNKAMAEAVGTWEVFHCYSKITGIAPAGNRIYVNASGNLYSYNLSDNSLTTYNKENGMGANNATLIAWVPQTKKLVILYNDYTIDLLSQDGSVETIVSLREKRMTTDKTTYSIYIDGQYAYLCTAFGLLKINTRDASITDTYTTGFAVMLMSIDNGTIYLAADNGNLYEARTNDNLVDKSVWIVSDTIWNDVKKSEEPEANDYGILIKDDRNNCYWGSNSEGKLTKYEKSDDGFTALSSGVMPDGLVTDACWRLYKHDGKVFATAGAYSAGMAYEAMLRKGLVQYYDGDKWHELDAPDVGNYTGANCMAFDPKDKTHFYVGASTGLYEYRDMKHVATYDANNSNMSHLYNNANSSDAVITSMLYDNSRNLWVMNGWCDNFITSFNSSNESTNYSHSEYNFTDLTTVDIQGAYISSRYNRMYMVNNYWSKPVLFCYDMNSDVLSGITSFVNTDGASISPLYLYGLAEDNEGNIWVASSSGPFYWSKSNILSGDATFTQYKVNRNDGTGLADYLMKDIPMRCVRVDAANRKWFGGRDNGVYLISSDNNTEMEHFTTSNSPLLSDVIYDVMIDDETGKVWFATDAGICSYQSDVTESYGSLSESTVYAYPNPVPPDYTDDITIKGLANNYQVTITTSSGHVVHKGVCSGGSYQWNGCDQKGERVASGVYMVLVSTDTGEKGCVTKIAMVK